MMRYILNEKSFIENIIANGLGDNSLKMVCPRIVQYYYDAGMSIKEIEEQLISFRAKFMPEYDTEQFTRTYKQAIRNIEGRSPIFVIDRIGITENELNKIMALQSPQAEKLAFCLLAISKYNHLRNNSDYYAASIPDGDLFRLANVTASRRERNNLLGDLEEAGLINTRAITPTAKGTKYINYYIQRQILFADEGGKIALWINQAGYNNLGWFYEMSIGRGKYYVCRKCGEFSRKQLDNGLCPKCAHEEHYEMRECIDCGGSFEVDLTRRGVKPCRCPECQEAREKRMNRARVQKCRTPQIFTF